MITLAHSHFGLHFMDYHIFVICFFKYLPMLFLGNNGGDSQF